MPLGFQVRETRGAYWCSDMEESGNALQATLEHCNGYLVFRDIGKSIG
jgi:hypothetical protein